MESVLGISIFVGVMFLVYKVAKSLDRIEANKTTPNFNQNINVSLHPNLVNAKSQEEFLTKYICLEIGKFIKDVLDKTPEQSKGKVLTIGLKDLQKMYLENADNLAKETRIPFPKIIRIINDCFETVYEI